MGNTAQQIMGARGDDVATIGPDGTLQDVVDLLAAKKIGAVIVVDRARAVVGIVSERDVVRVLSRDGAGCLELAVRDVMTGPVTTCDGSATADELMQTMTNGRFRHVPVTGEGNRLEGIVSIGDVVKTRIEALVHERAQLTEYVTGGY